ncbi:hypothetical protein B5V01_08180 [Mesorhizobium erdmanii]|uniref:Uncharacterized protein n=2 Tax=Mesorhizobium TaxID=68287 RepID=A0A3M9X4L8_9HYPH|nr:hypothetical protein DNR46_28745 [Mesorhizobium japonicum]RXT47930.1 hypothetical protein B5V01_08180 [Mesorhizobium erdmanii]
MLGQVQQSMPRRLPIDTREKEKSHLGRSLEAKGEMMYRAAGSATIECPAISGFIANHRFAIRLSAQAQDLLLKYNLFPQHQFDNDRVRCDAVESMRL